jgi:murein DD-endopeptidase MepM/ murein hydrolase activator NlpD
MYNPVIARFMQEDTYQGDIRDPLSLNLYAYCRNNPLIYVDPDGHKDVAVRASNESQGNKVTFNAGTKGNSTIKITTSSGSSKTLKEGKDYYISKDGKAYYTNDSSNAVRSTNESKGSSVSYSSGSKSGSSTITVTSSNSKTVLKEGTDYYIGNDGTAYYYGNVRSVNEVKGSSVSYSSGSSKGSSTITVTNSITKQTTTLKEGKDYYIGTDGKAHYFTGAPSPGLVTATGAPSTGTIKPTNDVSGYTNPIRQEDWSQILPLNDGREFGNSRDDGTRAHAAIDFYSTNEKALSVHAITSGTVVRINPTYWYGTSAVYVKNDDGTLFVYAEVAVPANLKVGDRVGQGNQISTMKQNTFNDGVMLHLEYYQNGDAGGYVIDNSNTQYDYVAPRDYQRRQDLLDPTFVYSLPFYK